VADVEPVLGDELEQRIVGRQLPVSVAERSLDDPPR
jgi:hypothetical protein